MDILPVPFWEEHPDEYMQLFRTLADYIKPGPGWGWVVPTFQQGVDWTNGHFYSGCLVINGPGVVWEDVPYGELSDDDSFLNDIGSWMRVTNDYAVNKRGFVGAFPTMFTGYYPAGKGRVCGTVFLTSEAAEWHDVSKFVQGKCVIDDINNIPARFRGTQRFVENIPGGRFVGGSPICTTGTPSTAIPFVERCCFIPARQGSSGSRRRPYTKMVMVRRRIRELSSRAGK